MTFLSDKKRKKNNFKLYIFSKKSRDSGSSNDAAGVEMENNGIELHSKNNDTTQWKMEEWQNNVMYMQKIYIDRYISPLQYALPICMHTLSTANTT